jgi:hypothetical protein
VQVVDFEALCRALPQHALAAVLDALWALLEALCE